MASTPAGLLIPVPIFYKRSGQTDSDACPVAKDAKAESPARAVTRQFTSSGPPHKPVVKRKREADAEPSERQPKMKKEEREELVNRKHWLFEHRALFEPLLPQRANSYITNLVKEMEGQKPQSSLRRDFVVQPDSIVGGEMKPYQLAGLSFLAYMYRNGINCILGDEMGLGKTLQTLSLFAHIKETATSHQPHLIVCPLSVLSSWEAECRRWIPSMHLVRFHGTSGERERIKGLMRENADVDIVLTTYETLSAGDLGWLKTRHFGCVVLDEGHRIKNSESEVAKHAASLGGLWRIILTGTPIQNNLVELWSLLHWLYPQIFSQTTRALFAESFDLSHGTYALPVLNAVRALLGTIQLRRTKSGLAGSGDLGGVPPREDYTVFVPFTEAQRFWTYRMLTRLDKVDLEVLFPRKKDEGDDDERREVLSHLENHAKASANQWKNFSMLLMQLRRICDHPYMIDDAQPEAYEIGEHVVAASSKLLAIDKILADVLPKGERVLIFSQWTDMLDLLEDHMVLRDIPYVRLDGSVSRARREMVIRMFQHKESPYKVFLISTKAGGLGINLTQASVCILCDSDWNPQNDLQAIARAHRIGQTKVVKVYRLVCRASVEDQMLDRIRRKLFLSAKIIGLEAGGSGSGGQGEGGPQGGVGGSELMSILRRGSSALTRSDDDMGIVQFRAASLQEILQVSEARTTVHDARVKHELKIEDAPEAVLKSAEEEERELLSGVARVQSYLFEGTVLERTKVKEESVSVILGKRARGADRIVQYGGMSFIRDDSMQEMMESKSNAPPAKAKRIPFEWEDYCIACRDGGEVVICNNCPRVFHAECHPSLTAAQVHASLLTQCPQHKCCKCSRVTAAAGGLLLRCQTCPQAICTDCVCWEDIKLVGDVIPEFVCRKFGKKDGAYFIRCADCCEQAKLDPKWAKDWEKDIAESKRLVNLM